MQSEYNTKDYSSGFSGMKALLLGAVIVVILVIIVLVSVTSNTRKQEEQSQNDIIKGSLAIVLTNGVVYLDRNSTFKDFCKNDYFTGPAATIAGDGGSAICNVKSDNKAWCACSSLKTTSIEPAGSTFCVDSRGYKRITQNEGGCEARCASDGICAN